MKNILVLILLSISTIASATDYYVSASSPGSDSNNGTSSSTPWQTISRVNSAFSTFNAGDRILFKRGDSFYGSIMIAKSGSTGSHIIFGAYGTGSDPVLTGFTTLGSWTNEAPGIWARTVACESAPTFILIDNKWFAMGRHPNSTYLKYESHSSNVTITDNELSVSPDWTGAEAVIRKDDWTLDRCKIINHSGQIINYSSLGISSDATNGFGYFIQNDLRTLDSYGEWYYNGSKLYVFFGTELPTNHIIKVPTIDYLIYNYTFDYLTIENIRFVGSGSSAIHFENYADYFMIRNCSFDFSGENAIEMIISRYGTIDNNKMDHSIRAGVYENSGNGNYITNNTIKNSGMLLGADMSGVYCDGIYSNYSDNVLIQYNNIDSIAYNGLFFTGNNVQVKNNFIQNSCLNLNDGGGIYTNGTIFTGRVIEGNIILNSFGNGYGTPDPERWYAEGIYLDAPLQLVEVKNNTIAYCRRSGIFFHESHDNSCSGNICYSNLEQVRLQFGGINPNDRIRNINFSQNILIARTSNQLALWAGSALEDIPLFLISDNNYFARPLDDDDVFYTYAPSSGAKYRTLSGWQALTLQDANSKKSPIALNDTANIDFYYNNSKTNKIIPLVQPMLDFKGASYINSVTLTPFTSIVLMVDPNPPIPVVPVYLSSVVNNLTPSKLEITYTVNLDINSVPLVADFIVKIDGTTRAVTAVQISGAKVFLTLASPVVFGNIVKISYTQNPGKPLQTPSFGLAANLTDQLVTNNLVDPSIPNDPPFIVVNYEEDVFSGFVYELDASGSTDANNDILTFKWTIPADIPVSAIEGSRIKFLSPVSTNSQVINFGLAVSDGKLTTSRNLTINNLPYKPGLGLGKAKIIEASNYYLTDYPDNVDDGNLSTKWSVNGDNQWLTISLTSPLKINHLQIALLPDQKYESFFDVFASKDNILWEPVLQNAASCGFSGDLQNFNLPADKTSTEYYFVKLLGHGNSQNTWNNYSEIRIFGSPGGNFIDVNDPGNISIYPNPVRDLINILVLEPSSDYLTLRIFDLAGKVRFETKIDPGVNNVQVPVVLSPGTYIVQVLSGKLIQFAQTLIIAK